MKLDAPSSIAGAATESPPASTLPARLQRWLAPAMGALAAINTFILVAYVTVVYRHHFHSDAAVKNLIADEIRETGQFFPATWNHVNGDLLVLFGHLVVLPLSAVFPNGFGLHAASALTTSALILAAGWLLSGLVTDRTWLRLLYVAILASGVSAVVAESMYGQVSYGTVFYIGALGLVFAWRARSEGRRRTAWLVALFALTLLAYWSNPQRAAASYTLPMLAAIGASIWLRRDGQPLTAAARSWVAVVAAMLAGGVAGTVLHAVVLAGVENAPGAGYARWLTFKGMVDNGVLTLQGVLAALGGVPTAGEPVTSGAGAYEAIRLLAALVVLATVPIALLRLMRSASEALRFVAAFSAALLALFLFLHATTTIPDMTDPVNSARYLVPALLTALLPLLAWAVHARSGRIARAGVVAAAMVLATSAFAPGNPFSAIFRAPAKDPREALLTALRARGLHYGYASYWNAGVLTVLSAGDVKVRQVLPDNGLPVPMRHLSSNRWYEPEAWTGPTFLALTDAESRQVNWGLLTSYAGLPTMTFKAGDMNVSVFDRNLAGVLPNWSAGFARPLQLRVTATSPHTVGRYEPMGVTGRLAAAAGEAGFLHFGPYLKVPAGRYRAVYDVESAAPGGMQVDATSSQSAKVHGSRMVDRAGRQKVVVDIDLGEDVADMELRVATNGAGAARLYGITFGRR